MWFRRDLRIGDNPALVAAMTALSVVMLSYRFHLNEAAQEAFADGRRSASASAAPERRAQRRCGLFQGIFSVRAAVISRGIRALRGKVLDLTIAGNWSYEMEPVLPTMSHRNFRHFSIERGRFCNGRPP
jgi:hypothetical protein